MASTSSMMKVSDDGFSNCLQFLTKAIMHILIYYKGDIATLNKDEGFVVS